MTSPGPKNDLGKPTFARLPQTALLRVAEVRAYGIQKYGGDNWTEIDNVEMRMADAALRHQNARLRGEILDPESGLPHLAHAICSLLFQLETEEQLRLKSAAHFFATPCSPNETSA